MTQKIFSNKIPGSKIDWYNRVRPNMHAAVYKLSNTKKVIHYFRIH